ncbi:hypothetical protein [Sorangium sp. So ce124]|uniref:hypothetical protein n=1 Tax=Sorangium sp. So ce124 TaxID=3133280 RepID=UPI003F5FA3F0
MLDTYGTQLSHETWILDPAAILRARFGGARDGSSSLALEVGEMIARWPLGAPAKDRYVSHPS